jgi:hypothetical protein
LQGAGLHGVAAQVTVLHGTGDGVGVLDEGVLGLVNKAFAANFIWFL